ncbi:MAG: hypothetical protein ACSHW1_20225 [Yoonia sp.]|uniref:hypothetical protein n=1 Tax=Yoonia sp. TaxID=2212373 RepID=UPI003EFA03DC
MFDGDIRNDRLVFSGAALIFLEEDDPSTFVPYHFAFDGTAFTQLPDTVSIAEFQEIHDVDFPISSGVDLESCVQPRPDTIATQDGISLIFPTLCRINSSVDGGASGIIGVILPVDNKSLELDGDAICRTEVAHWLTLDGFADPAVVLCAIVDQPYRQGSMSRFWMDVIFYRQHAGELYNMRADSRNFQRIN